MKKTLAMALAISLFFACSNQKTDDKAAITSDSAAVAPAKQLPTEIGDSKFVDIGKAGNAALSSGNIDAWMNSFADNAVYIWNNGDSIAGKPAITAYWKKRRGDVIDSISFSQEIWLAVKAQISHSKPCIYPETGCWAGILHRLNIKPEKEWPSGSIPLCILTPTIKLTGSFNSWTGRPSNAATKK